jgi:predicted acetylornithine/succinylornithine family transaminase
LDVSIDPAYDPAMDIDSSRTALAEAETQERISAREARFLLQAYHRSPVTVDRGNGCVFRDIEGRRYLDFITGIGVNALGYSHPRLIRTLQTQAELCLHTSNLFYHRYQGLLAERLVEWSGLDRVFFSNSGTEAVELALKAARAAGLRQRPAKRKIVALHNSFHGRSIGALAVTGQPKYRRPFEPLMDSVEFIAANDRDALRKAIGADTAAVIVEVVQGEGGIYPLSRAFVADVRDLTRLAGAMWIADETQCGLGRTGARFAYQMFGDIDLPDMVIAAKPLAGGLPLSATMFSQAAAAAIPLGMHGTTFGGGPLACRVAIEVLSILDELLPHVRSTGAYFQERLRWLAGRHRIITEIRGAGLMAGIQLGAPGDAFVDACLERGLAVNCTHDTVLRLLPPLIVTPREIDEALAILDDALRE